MAVVDCVVLNDVTVEMVVAVVAVVAEDVAEVVVAAVVDSVGRVVKVVDSGSDVINHLYVTMYICVIKFAYLFSLGISLIFSNKFHLLDFPG